MQYLEPVYRGKFRGENYEYVHVAARDLRQDERERLEDIAKKWTYVLGLFGNHKNNADNTRSRYRGIRGKVRFVEREGITNIYIQGPYATEIGFEIQDLPFVEFKPSKNQVITFSEEKWEDLVARVLDSREPSIKR